MLTRINNYLNIYILNNKTIIIISSKTMHIYEILKIIIKHNLFKKLIKIFNKILIMDKFLDKFAYKVMILLEEIS